MQPQPTQPTQPIETIETVDTIPLLTELFSLFSLGDDPTSTYNSLKNKFPKSKISFREVLNIINNIVETESGRDDKKRLLALIKEMDTMMEKEEKAEREKKKKAKLEMDAKAKMPGPTMG